MRQKSKVDGDFVKFNTMKIFKNSNDYNDAIPNLIKDKGSKHQRQERFDRKANITKIKHQECNLEVK